LVIQRLVLKHWKTAGGTTTSSIMQLDGRGQRTCHFSVG
jgi:hypothetical protein